MKKEQLKFLGGNKIKVISENIKTNEYEELIRENQKLKNENLRLKIMISEFGNLIKNIKT